MKNQPNKIFLQTNAEECEDFTELSGVSWSDESVYTDDLEYISVNFISERMEELEQRIDRYYLDEPEDFEYINMVSAILKELKNLIK